MLQSSRKRVVWRGLFGYSAIIKPRVKVERLAAVFNGGLQAAVNHVHKCHRVRIERAVGKRPIRMPRAPRRLFEEIAVEGYILPRKCPLLHPLAPLEECMREVGLRRLGGIGDLLACRSEE